MPPAKNLLIMTSYGGIIRIRLKGRSLSTSSQPAIFKLPCFYYIMTFVCKIRPRHPLTGTMHIERPQLSLYTKKKINATINENIFQKFTLSILAVLLEDVSVIGNVNAPARNPTINIIITAHLGNAAPLSRI